MSECLQHRVEGITNDRVNINIRNLMYDVKLVGSSVNHEVDGRLLYESFFSYTLFGPAWVRRRSTSSVLRDSTSGVGRRGVLKNSTSSILRNNASSVLRFSISIVLRDSTSSISRNSITIALKEEISIKRCKKSSIHRFLSEHLSRLEKKASRLDRLESEIAMFCSKKKVRYSDIEYIVEKTSEIFNSMQHLFILSYSRDIIHQIFSFFFIVLGHAVSTRSLRAHVRKNFQLTRILKTCVSSKVQRDFNVLYEY